MIKKILTPALFIVAALLVYNFFFKTPSFNNGAEVPEIKGQLLDGTEFQLSNLRGKYVLLDFWGSWCPPCLREIPDIKRFYTEHHGQSYKDADDFEIVSIALEKSDAYTKKIIEKENLNWPYHLIDVNKIIMLSSYAQDFDVKDLPTKFLISPKGEFMGTNLTWAEMDRIMRERRKT